MTLTKYQLSKVFIGCYKQCTIFTRQNKHFLIQYPR